MRVGIVGAGISGLAAARKLVTEGHEVVVYEAGSQVGGRAATEEIAGCIVDTGLQAYTPRGMAIEGALLRELSTEGLIRIEKPIYLLDHGRVIPGSAEKNAQPRYCYVSGARRFAELLAAGVDVRLETTAKTLGKQSQRYGINGDWFDFVVLTPPLPEVARLLATVGKTRNIGNASYRPCLSVVLVYKRALEPVPPFSALLSADRMSPVLWLGIETVKCEGRAPEGWSVFVAQLGPAFSRQHLEAREESLYPVASGVIARVFGKNFAIPDAVYVRRWVESQPERVALFQSVNPPGERVIIAGDGTLAGRAENAYESGLMAAARIMEAAK